MKVTKKEIRKALYRLKQDGKTPLKVINFIKDNLLDEVIEDKFIDNKLFVILKHKFPHLNVGTNICNEIQNFVKLGNKLKAVKYTMEMTKFSLRESKEIVDYIAIL